MLHDKKQAAKTLSHVSFPHPAEQMPVVVAFLKYSSSHLTSNEPH